MYFGQEWSGSTDWGHSSLVQWCCDVSVFRSLGFPVTKNMQSGRNNDGMFGFT